ncbi:Trans-2,3-enoyl-CoA reductase-like [Manis javanica]|nr:Trans-2,3-enoyl-CoA reductase-like [Manis javanica]
MTNLTHGSNPGFVLFRLSRHSTFNIVMSCTKAIDLTVEQPLHFPPSFGAAAKHFTNTIIGEKERMLESQINKKVTKAELQLMKIKKRQYALTMESDSVSCSSVTKYANLADFD